MATKSLDLPSAVIGKNAKPNPFLEYLKQNDVTDITTASISTLRIILSAYNHFVYKKLVDFAWDMAEKHPNSEYAESVKHGDFVGFNEWLQSVKQEFSVIESGFIPSNFWKPEIDYVMSLHYIQATRRVDDEDNRYKYTGNQIRSGLESIADKVERHGETVGNSIEYAGLRIGRAIEHAGRDISGRNPY